MTTPEDRAQWEADEATRSDFTPYSGSSKVPATFHAPQPTGDAEKAREARYAEAIVNAAFDLNPTREWASSVYAKAAMAVADAEVEAATRELRADVERQERVMRVVTTIKDRALARAEAAEAERDQLRAAIKPSELIAEMRRLTYFGEAHIAGQVVSKMMRERARVEAADTQPEGAGDDMCPNCVTPWKCNGPHTPTAGSKVDTAPEGLVLPEPVRCGSCNAVELVLRYSPEHGVNFCIPCFERETADAAPESGEGR